MLPRPLVIPLLAASLSLVLVVTGCEEKPVRLPSPRSAVAVELPPTPDLTPRSITTHHPDGTWTVEGLLKEGRHAFGKNVRVRGKVIEVVKCPLPPPPPPPTEPVEPPKPGAEELPPPPPPEPPRTCRPAPQAILAGGQSDRPEHRLLIAGSMWSSLASYEVGMEITAIGRYDIVSSDGVFLRQAGIVELADLPRDVPEPPAAPADAPPE